MDEFQTLIWKISKTMQVLMKYSVFHNRYINRVKFLIKLSFKKSFYFYTGVKKYDIIIFDNIFPHPVSGFRLEEFTTLLSEFKDSKILLTPDSYPLVGTPKEAHQVHINDFSAKKPDLKNRLTLLKGFINLNAKLFYCVFINNIYRFLDVLEERKIPFVFTLYPGGGFAMNNEVSDAKLKKVLSSKMFRKVTVTQKITKDYLLQNDFCKEDQIEYIFGGVVPQNSLVKNSSEKKYFPQDKNTFDICFCAAKYMPKGIDKGYDVFIELAHSLSMKYDFIKFHIIGGYDQNDIDVSKISDNITFYGYQKFEGLEKIFQKIDILISPNKPFVLGNGAFDGFPLGTVVEAALNGVMVMLSDSLQQNTTFVDQQEVFIVESSSEIIEKAVSNLINNPERIKEIATKGKLKFQEVYSNKMQMNPRIKIIKEIIDKK